MSIGKPSINDSSVKPSSSSGPPGTPSDHYIARHKTSPPLRSPFDTVTPFAALERSPQSIEPMTRAQLSSHDLPPVYQCGEAPWRTIVIDCPQTAKAIKRVAQLASSNGTVLFFGAPGTGKQLFSRLLHALSDRHDQPMVYFDCNRQPSVANARLLFGCRDTPGYIEMAAGGTLLIRNVECLDAEAQRRLLVLLRESLFSRLGESIPQVSQARIVVTTSANLQKLSARQSFLPELYYHLRVLRIGLPQLQARGPASITRLARVFIGRAAARLDRPELTLHPSTLQALGAYPWPNNLRELEQALNACALITDGEIRPGLLPHAVRKHPATLAQHQRLFEESPLDQTSAAPRHPFEDDPSLETLTGRYIAYLLGRHGGNRSACARALGIGRNTLLTKMRQHDLC